MQYHPQSSTKPKCVPVTSDARSWLLGPNSILSHRSSYRGHRRNIAPMSEKGWDTPMIRRRRERRKSKPTLDTVDRTGNRWIQVMDYKKYDREGLFGEPMRNKRKSERSANHPGYSQGDDAQPEEEMGGIL